MTTKLMIFALLAVSPVALAHGQVAGESPIDVIAAPPQDAAQLVVYRAYAEPTAWSPTLKIDGRKIVAIPNRHYTVTKVPVGDRRVALAWPIFATMSGSNMELTVEGGKTYYIEVTGVSQYNPASGYIRTGSGIALIEPTVGAAIVRKCCKYRPPKG